MRYLIYIVLCFCLFLLEHIDSEVTRTREILEIEALSRVVDETGDSALAIKAYSILHVKMKELCEKGK